MRERGYGQYVKWTDTKPLLDAAEEVRKLRAQQVERARAYQSLARAARECTLLPEEIDRRRTLLDEMRVPDFGAAIDRLCAMIEPRDD